MLFLYIKTVHPHDIKNERYIFCNTISNNDMIIEMLVCRFYIECIKEKLYTFASLLQKITGHFNTNCKIKAVF